MLISNLWKTDENKRATREPATPPEMMKEELFARMNASAERMLESLQSAYFAGMKEGMDHDHEDHILELLQKTKKLRDEVQKISSQPNGKPKTTPTN